MWKKIRDFHANHDAGALETMRATTGLAGISFLFFTVMHLISDGDFTAEWGCMALAGLFGLACCVGYGKLISERTNRKP